MRKEDLRLRALAKKGDIDAGVLLGMKYLSGSDGFPEDVATGIGYMAGRLDHPEVQRYLAEKLPIDFLIEMELIPTLRAAATGGSELASRKYGLFLYLSGDGEQAYSWLKKGAGAPNSSALSGSTLEQLVNGFLRAADFDLPRTIEQMLRRCQTHQEPHLCKIALQSSKPSALVHSKVLELLQSAANPSQLAPLDARDVSASLAFMSLAGSKHAQYILGRSLLGLSCGSLPAEAVAPKPNYREGYTYLLRAAHQGVPLAWYDLFVACSDYRSVLANQTAAQFFLEQAAANGVAPAKTCLAARILLDAGTVEDLARGQQWLCEAAEGGEQPAASILDTFVLRRGSVDASAYQVADKIAALEPALAIILKLAAVFCLTRKEALSLTLENAVVYNSLILPPSSRMDAGFALPARTAEAASLLREVAALAPDVASSGAGFARRRGVAQRALFTGLNLQESMFFLPEDADSDRQRSIGKWRSANRALLKKASQVAVDHKL